MDLPVNAATVLAQLGHYAEPRTGGLVPSIHPGVTSVPEALRVSPLPGAPQQDVASGYARSANSGAALVESILAQLEGGDGAAAFTAGSAAAHAVLATLQPGDHVLLDVGIYYEFGEIIRDFCNQWHVELTHVDMCDVHALRRVLQSRETTLLWAECPSNPTWRVPDIAMIAQLAHSSAARLLVDSTVATPLLCRPLAFGADLVLHSATKYLNGHGDVLAGVLVSARLDENWVKILSCRVAHGSLLPAFEAWLLLRGLRSLSPRFERASNSAMRIATVLANDPHVASVHYPGLPDDPYHGLARRQFTGGFGAMLSFCIDGSAHDALAVRDRTKVFRRSTSLGSTESLIEHRHSTEGLASLCSPALIRLSIGLEDVEDLLDDLRQALTDAPLMSA